MSDEARFLNPRVLVPFTIITLIWGSTWLVIKGQLGIVPAPWSVTYRFTIGCAALFAVAAWRGTPLGIGRNGHLLALGFGIPQFCLNFNFVYAAEHYVTSGLVAVVFALLFVPNSAFGRIFLRHPVTPRFLAGSAIAVAGVALLFLHELHASDAAPGKVMIGIGCALAGVLAASISNVMQAAERLRRRAPPAMIAWGMAYGAAANALFAWALHGHPVLDPRPEYWLGLVYLGLIASAIAFTLYFGVIRAIGPAKAAYSSLIIPVIAMALSTIFEGYRWSLLAVAGAALALTGLAIALKSRQVAR